MTTFEKYISQIDAISFDKIHSIANELLRKFSKDERDVLYKELVRGKGILDDEDHLNMYLHSYASMHKAKLVEAFNNFSGLPELCKEKIEIFDWGCGQGIATICLLDYLREKKISPAIERISLIEPSKVALSRANVIISKYDDSIKVRKINKQFDDLEKSDVTGKKCIKLHLFSNILDVAAFDLVAFTRLFQETQKGENYVICVGPCYDKSSRIEYFYTALNPAQRLASFNKSSGEWLRDWTISLNIFSLQIKDVENPEVVRQRIENAKRVRQFHAGYVLDWVDEQLNSSCYSTMAESLMKRLSAFDVRSNQSMELPEDIDPLMAVMYNIITRGLPTKAPIMMESLFSQSFRYSSESDKESPFIAFHDKGKVDAKSLFEALHVIDPRFNTSMYNQDILESSFEKSFIKNSMDNPETAYLAQVLEPQRWLSSLIRIPDKKFSKDQRVDFAIELPYSDDSRENLVGFIIEVDGAQYHSNIISQIRDERRNRITYQNGWDTYRLTEANSKSFSVNWEDDNKSSAYLNILKRNYDKCLDGEWAEIVQSVLSPFAVARVEVVMLYALITGKLDLSANVWNIAVIERDVPCTYLALQNFKELLEHLSKLKGVELTIPEINVKVVSTPEFIHSKLHGTINPVSEVVESEEYDLCIDISMLIRDKVDSLPINLKSESYYVIRSSHYEQDDRTILTSTNIDYPPFVTKDEKGIYKDITERKELLRYFLSNIFRKTDFRQGQLPIISRALANKTTIGLLPTGGGKSLTYQLSSILQPGVTIVVDPLITLMDDQYKGLRRLRVDSCDFINSKQTASEKAIRLGKLQNGKLQFIFLSPERFMMENFRSSLYVMFKTNKVYFSYGVIDEVHCVSEWGHDFRPAYLQLGRNMMCFMHTKSGAPVTMVGLTATASFDVLADVERELTTDERLKMDSESIVRPEIDERAELTYRIVNVDADFSLLKNPNREPELLDVKSDWGIRNFISDAKKSVVEKLLVETPHELAKKNRQKYSIEHHTVIPHFNEDNFYAPNGKGEYENAGIIFCPHTRGGYGVEDTESRPGIATYVGENVEGLSIGQYVGGLDPEVMHPFINNHQNLMTATKAFGMGIDKPNVRESIHLSHPSSIEEFVQEAGRCGRDRKNAICYLLYEPMEYLHLSIGNIADIENKCGEDLPTKWLDNYRQRFVLMDDFRDLCMKNGCSKEEAEKIFQVTKGFSENDDENIQLYFHNNSFRGAYKEKLMLYELTYRIMNVRPTNILKIQNDLCDMIGKDDVVLKVDSSRNSLKVLGEGGSKQYGYIFLDSLFVTFKFSDYEEKEREVVIEPLMSILHSLPNASADWLMKPQVDVPIDNDGIYASMKNLADDGYTYVTITWTNSESQDPQEYLNKIVRKANEIADRQGWNHIDEEEYGSFSLNHVNNFEDLLQEIYNRSHDQRWLINHSDLETFKPLLRQFWSIRDKDDTDKAIYRLSCIGLVEDVLIDYNSETYQLKIRKRKDGEYYERMRIFFEKYYSHKKALSIVREIKKYPTKYDNELDKCIGYLTEFVYNTLAKKRRRAIEDMRYACYEGLSKGDEELKQFIHLYFNSKYAREHYDVDGEDYSLTNDVVNENWCDFDLVKKYIKVIGLDSSGSEKDNVKHLYGAVLLLLRDRPNNYALHLLRSYCIANLGVGKNDVLLNNFKTSLLEEGFSKMSESLSIEETFAVFNEFVTMTQKVSNEKILLEFLDKAESELSLCIFGKWFSGFAAKYVK